MREREREGEDSGPPSNSAAQTDKIQSFQACLYAFSIKIREAKYKANLSIESQKTDLGHSQLPKMQNGPPHFSIVERLGWALCVHWLMPRISS